MLNKYQILSNKFFLNREGQPFCLTPGQSEIFKLIYEPEYLRVAIRTITQYGKSDVASQALITATIVRQEKTLIVSPSIKQSLIIMGNVIGHLFDHKAVTSHIEFEGSLERLKQERSKNRITFKTGGEIFILTAEADTVSKEAKNLMGFGATIVLTDESALIPDLMFSKILRMVGGVKNGKLIQLGNPFDPNNHFARAFISPRYEKLVIDWRQALAEGRLSQDFLDEAREEMPPLDFRIFYECQFPEGGAEDSLIPYDWIMTAINQEVSGGMKQAGLDVARFGRDKSVYIARDGGKVTGIEQTQDVDTMGLCGWVSGFIDKDGCDTTCIDVVGIGSGVYDRLAELGKRVSPVNVGESPTNDENKQKFFNLRAEIFWNLREWFRPENGKSKISIPADNELIRQLSELKYKFSSEKKIRIEDKEDMKKRIGRSPDMADSLALAFWDKVYIEPELIVY